MIDFTALYAALAMRGEPALVRTARRSQLPKGMTHLLKVAAGDQETLDAARLTTSRTDHELRIAAGFFIEQVLLTNNDNAYRILGAAQTFPTSELRLHMALLLKWLHPDVANNEAMHDGIDRTVFANRVTQAWEDLKTNERRAAYAPATEQRPAAPRPLKGKSAKMGNSAPPGRQRTGEHSGKILQFKQSPNKRAADRFKIRRLSIYRTRRDGLLTRLMLFLKGQR